MIEPDEAQPESKSKRKVNWEAVAAIAAIPGALAVVIALFVGFGGEGEEVENPEPTDSSITAAPTTTTNRDTTSPPPSTSLPPPTTSPPPPPPPVDVPVSQSHILGAEGSEWEAGRSSVQIGGDFYDDVLWACGSGQGINCAWDQQTTWVELGIPGHPTEFASFLGLSDKSPGDCQVRTRIYVDGVQRAEHSLTAGVFEDVNLPIDGARRIKIEANFDVGRACYLTYAEATWRTAG